MDTKQKVMYREVNTHTDENGVVIENSQKKVIRVPKTPEFVMVFTKHLSYLNQLTQTEHNILYSILNKFVGYNNLIVFNSQVNADIMKSMNIKKSTYSGALKGLRAKYILVEIEGFTYLNPEFFGKGNWEDIQRLRTEVVYDFDFNSLKATQHVKQISSFVDDIKEFVDSHDVKSLSRNLNPKGGEDLTIYVEEKEDEQYTPTLPFFTEEEENESDKLSLIREENRQLELKIRLAEIERGIG